MITFLKIVGTFALMLFTGFITLVVAIAILWDKGIREHGNYEYYGQYPISLWGPVVIGFLAPGVVVWYLDRRGFNKGWKVVGTLALMAVSGVITYAVEWQIIWELGRRLQGDEFYYWRYPAVTLGFYVSAIIGFLAPRMIVWKLHRKAMTNEHSP